MIEYNPIERYSGKLGNLCASEKELSDNIFERGEDDNGFGRIRSKGDAAIFGGHATQAMKDKFGITQAHPLVDFLPTLTIAATNLATEMTHHNMQQADLRVEPDITKEHVQNNKQYQRAPDARSARHQARSIASRERHQETGAPGALPGTPE